MNKKTLALTLGSAMASALLAAAPSIQAGENPFAMANIDSAQQLAAADDKTPEADNGGKLKEGKCGEGKCGAKKTQDGKGKEGSCGASKMQDGKAKEGSCGGAVKK